MTLQEHAAGLNQEEIVELLREHQALSQHNSELKQQLAWFKRQLFGVKSERRLIEPEARQMSFAAMLTAPEAPPPPTQSVKAYQRQRHRAPWEECCDEPGVRFDSSVPLKVIEVPNPEVQGRSVDDYEVVGEKVTYRLAQKPGAYVVLKYVRKVIKLKDTQSLACPPAPPAVLEKSVADVSFLVGLLLDKFRYHLPLYRQHQRLAHAGIRLSRVTLTNLVHRTVALLEPIYHALVSSIVQSEVLAMDETPIKAGRKVKGKMHTGYFWPMYGDKDEIAFPFAASRATPVVREALGALCGVLLTDGYTVYESFAQKVNGIVRAQCWVHTRRRFVEAEAVEPQLVSQALEFIGLLYVHEATAQKRQLEAEHKLEYRAEHAKPVVDTFFAWLEHTFETHVLLPSNPFAKAAYYALERQAALRVFLEYPNVPLDINHLEREIRPVALGRKNWLFCWTEVGARYAGIAHSLIASCRLQGIDPYLYLVDVLQRIDTHPAFEVHMLTPRLWKQHFAENPLRSDLERLCQ